MKVRSNIKAGGLALNHNEKMTDGNNVSIERGKGIFKKLSLKKETIRELKEAELRGVAGGRVAPTDFSCPRTNCCEPAF